MSADQGVEEEETCDTVVKHLNIFVIWLIWDSVVEVRSEIRNVFVTTKMRAGQGP